MAGPVPRHAHQRRQRAGIQYPALREPSGSGIQAGWGGAAPHQVSAVRVLQATVRPHGQGQGQGSHGSGLQARQAVQALLTEGQAYDEQGLQYDEERYRERVISQLQQRAHSLGKALVPTT